jgi:hypothetical protein
MRRSIPVFSIVTVMLLLLLWSNGAAGQNNSSSAAPKPPAKKAAAKPAAKAPAKRVPIGQKVPTRDRYIEIQEALKDAGYFSGAANGTWGPASIEALQKFQTDEGLQPTGKIDSLTLIRLNLGPQYEESVEGSKGGTRPPG